MPTRAVVFDLYGTLIDDAPPSDYARFLAEKGEGVHHIAVAPINYDQALTDQANQGSEPVLSGTFSGFRVAYLPTERDLGVILEIFSGPPADEQKPDAT